MLSSIWRALVAALLAEKVSAACSSNLVIDNFSQWSSNSNSLGSWTSDDGSMTSISASGSKLVFTPSANSYFYETLPCTAASTEGYDAISFTFKGPAGGSAMLEIQAKASCEDATYASSWVQINDLTGSSQTIEIPLSDFSGINANGVTGFVWSTWSSTDPAWELGNIQFVCTGGNNPTTTTPPGPEPTGDCSHLVIDDWESQSRLTFLYYNAMIQPTSDDGTMASIVVSNDNRVTLTPNNADSYFYSKTTCINTVGRYGGISLRVKAPAGSSFGIQLSSPANCGDEEETGFGFQTTAELGWTFDGTEKLYDIDFSRFSGVDLAKVQTVFFSGLTGAVTFGPMAFYCGDQATEYVVPVSSAPPGPTATVPAPSATASALVIDRFGNQAANALGFWHGADEGMDLTWGNQQLTIKSSDSDYSFYTQLSGSCRDITNLEGSYLHIAYSGSNKFTVAMQQHNEECNAEIAPYPATWDSIEAARYASATDIYIPISHFNIEHTRVIGLSFKGFYTTDTTVLRTVEIVPSVPAGFTIPSKLPSGNLVFACKRPNSFAFAIDDGDPTFAQEVLQIIKEEDIKVTFFTVGAPLEDAGTNLTNVYNEMLAAGHQVALHTYTHPKMEGLPDYEAIDWEYNKDIEAVAEAFNGLHTPYFRPPFGNEGARMRQRLAATLDTDEPYIVNWSVDVEDWLWATGPTPEKQLDAFNRDVQKGGNLVVMHYLYPSTVGYLREFIQIAKATGKQLMRVDQCMEDPNAPAL
jgi:peptidoglycan/xylan/chitin deacetylase (PgdA/CDA1 family)